MLLTYQRPTRVCTKVFVLHFFNLASFSNPIIMFAHINFENRVQPFMTIKPQYVTRVVFSR